jgi:Cytosine/adenosine deaminases
MPRSEQNIEHDERMMRLAIAEARTAEAAGEVPVGAIVVAPDGETILGHGQNRVLRDNDPTAHCEIVAMREAGRALQNYRLLTPEGEGCTLYVTLEPCAMCAGAMALARVEALRFAAEDPKGGGVVHGARVFSQPTCHHRPNVLGGIGEAEAAELLKGFFAERR